MLRIWPSSIACIARSISPSFEDDCALFGGVIACVIRMVVVGEISELLHYMIYSLAGYVICTCCRSRNDLTRFGLGLGQRSISKFSLITLHSSYSDSSDTRRCTVTVVTCAHLTEQCMCSCWSHCRQYRASFKLCRTCRRTEQEPRLLLWGVRSSRNVHHPQQPAIAHPDYSQTS